MAEATLHHAVLPDGKPCLLRFEDGRCTLEIPDADPGVEAFQDLRERAVESRLVLRLDNGKVATLLHNYYAGRRVSTGVGVNFCISTVGSNRVVIGGGEFNEGTLVHRFGFLITHEEYAFLYRQHRGHASVGLSETVTGEALFSRRFGLGDVLVDAFRKDKMEPCEVVLPDISVMFDINVIQRHSPVSHKFEEERRVIITYVDRAPLARVLTDMYYLLAFFSLMVGATVSARQVRFLDGPDSQEGVPDYFELFVSPPANAGELETLEPLLSIERHGGDYAEAVRIWLARRDQWGGTYHHLRDNTFSKERGFGKDRYLSALGWFESVPLFYVSQKDLIPDEKLQLAIDAAIGELRGLEALNEDRIRSLLMQLNQPSLSTKLRCAIDWLAGRYGGDIFPYPKAKFVKMASKIRHLYAHGELPEDSYDWPTIIMCVMGVEFICSLLTISDLPVSAVNLQNAHNHPMQFAWRYLRERAEVS